MTEQPFSLHIPDSELELLQKKLALTRLPDELDEAGWEYGAPLADVKRLVERWQNGWDWRRYEAEINELPMFTRDIDVDGFGTLNIHYIHQKSEVKGAIPLLFVHGWPGHFLEPAKLLPLLTASSPDHPSFHVVSLGLPGYGFSEAPKKKGFRMAQYAEVGHKLMLALGYSEYVTQGGDWGYRITRMIALKYGGKHAKAWHTNFPRGEPPVFTKNPIAYIQQLLTPYQESEKAGLERSEWFSKLGRGYYAQQSTQPQTLGYSLADSPAGLLAWLYEKLHHWTDAYPWKDDEILDWVSIYWFSRAGPAASIRIYYEVEQGGDIDLLRESPKIPMGLSYFPKELVRVPKRYVPQTFAIARNVVFESEWPSGGHFAAHEKPEELATDLRKMFGKGGKAYGVVPGKDGY
ncbi:alpha/beta-hydrolase [Punctularia strigosozonata HHB-11173 SS5]|uniref:alpha/beta-hydrolase n=1 Tax=Punctularia strigosozonata (strain HHB-11173) TaxID=741275 RepID=UPI000441864C|nr:alpha/beta-hydrolase [Punctularia strigosozonata HHB-11173 SS5]EIN09296.1 alpha/beta-hydrolase [Punctularia strigosozonata HHB-11173 SS5]